jgi:mono/diheme cytochrome c family protein
MPRSFAFTALIAVVCAVALPARALADDADRVAAGRQFALKVCWACHIVAENQTERPILSHPAPSFLSIARRPDLTEVALRKFLSTHDESMGSNGRMPNPRLVTYQIDEIVAYLLSLKK